MSVADVLRAHGFVPAVPAAGNNREQRKASCDAAVPTVPAVPAPKHKNELTGHAEAIEAAYRALRQALADNPECKRAARTVETGDDTGPVLLAVGIRGIGFATLAIERGRYDGFELLRILDRVSARDASRG